ncbi:hypothetical protein RB195_016646 [Necator americanus]|uniref:Secreted protein n=1 Tax=Necator americanus TaxID=51031 RepID=A0ABR1C409_NECAM
MIGFIVLFSSKIFAVSLFLATHIGYCNSKQTKTRHHLAGKTRSEAPERSAVKSHKSDISPDRIRHPMTTGHSKEKKNPKKSEPPGPESLHVNTSKDRLNAKKRRSTVHDETGGGPAQKTRRKKTRTLEDGKTGPNDPLMNVEEMAKECGDYDNLDPNEANDMETAIR